MPFENIGLLQNIDFDSDGNLLNKSLGTTKPVLFMVWGSYCGHCVSAKPEFGKLFDYNKQKKVFLASLQTDDKDPDVQLLMKRFPSIMRKNNIEFNGVPSYIYYKDKTYIEYQGGRDFESLKKFVNNLP